MDSLVVVRMDVRIGVYIRLARILLIATFSDFPISAILSLQSSLLIALLFPYTLTALEEKALLCFANHWLTYSTCLCM